LLDCAWQGRLLAPNLGPIHIGGWSQTSATRRPTEFLVEGLYEGDEGPADVAVLFMANASSAVLPPLERREANNLASFVGGDTPLEALGHWRSV
jgi:hypothetical protein